MNAPRHPASPPPPAGVPYQPVLRHAPSGGACQPPLDPARLDWRDGVVVRGTNWLGDLLMSLPATWQLRRLLPAGLPLTVLTPAALASLWQACPWVDRVLPFTGRRVEGAPARAVRALGAGVAVVLPNSFGAALDLWRKGIPVRIGRRGRWRAPLLTHGLPPLRHTMHVGQYHQLAETLEVVSVLGQIEWSAEHPPLRVAPAEGVLAGLGLPAAAARGLLAIAPGAAFGPAKQWPVEHFRAVAQWWLARGGAVVALGTRTERAVAEAAVGGLERAWNLAGRTTLQELMSLLRGCRAAVANDSGLMHLAAALGLPGVALYGCTDPVGTGPVGPGTWRVLLNGGPCAPCFLPRCPQTGGACRGLQSLPPERACAALAALVG